MHVAPKIKLLKEVDKRNPYPISWEEQEKLLAVLPKHLKNLVLFAVNTGCRERVIRKLRWEWEIPVPELSTSVFVVPGYIFDFENEDENNVTRLVKNGEDRLVILNKIAKEVIESVRGQHPIFVFTYKGKPITSGLNNTSWQKARKKVGLDQVRFHDLKHTFGRRLRSAGVKLEDRKDLLGHKTQGHITTHYSAAELENLLEAANSICDKKRCGTLLRTIKQLRQQKPQLEVIS